jgi:hypothetical protein
MGILLPGDLGDLLILRRRGKVKRHKEFDKEQKNAVETRKTQASREEREV